MNVRFGDPQPVDQRPAFRQHSGGRFQEELADLAVVPPPSHGGRPRGKAGTVPQQVKQAGQGERLAWAALDAGIARRAAVQRCVQPDADTPVGPFRDRAGGVGAAAAVHGIRRVRRTPGGMGRTGVGEPREIIRVVTVRDVQFRGRAPAQAPGGLAVTVA